MSQIGCRIFTKVDPSQPLEDIDRERIFYIPYSELENGINGNTSYFCNGVCKATPSDQLLSLYDPADKRYKASYSTSSPTRLTLKFWPESASFGVGGVVSDGDIVMYRMSDLVLLHAEALAATGQIDAAVKELNKIHERAGLEAYRSSEFITPEECIGAILKERTIELVGEGKYWFDLLRTGHASDIGGVDSQEARDIVMSTMKGAIALLETYGTLPQQEIDKVTTPGGYTFRGLAAMEEKGFSDAVLSGLESSM